MTGARRRLHLAVRLPDADATGTPGRPGSRAGFASFERSARTAERGLFDFVLLGGGPLPYGPGDGVHDDGDAVARPEPITLLSALAAVTDRLGLAATVYAGSAEPFTAARALASLDHLSGGRAAWHVADPPGRSPGSGAGDDGAGTGARAEEFIRTARGLWDSWTPAGEARRFSHSGPYFTTAGEFTLPRPPQGHPVIIRAADRGEDPARAAGRADVLVTRYDPHDPPGAGRAGRTGAGRRPAAHGPAPGGIRVMPAVGVVLGSSDAEARERAAEIRRREISPEHAIAALERIWGRDLSSYDPDGPLPGVDPAPDSALTRGSRVSAGDRLAVAARWRALSAEGGLSIRQTVAETTGRQSFIGTPGRVAEAMEEYVRGGAADGFVLVPRPAGGGLDDFVARVVPLLQERGVFRTRYTGTTLRSHLGLAEPVWKG
ncbi:LLM class flavin-dependent oxidoreductase [Streptomyces sp. NPDC004609]|uniref:LLM class flavin-dependent oxidoreductase n=1 Tax=Streptomyces sp. NPDC004609 TaxID=3364704 RepID=UPI0036751DCC